MNDRNPNLPWLASIYGRKAEWFNNYIYDHKAKTVTQLKPKHTYTKDQAILIYDINGVQMSNTTPIRRIIWMLAYDEPAPLKLFCVDKELAATSIDVDNYSATEPPRVRKARRAPEQKTRKRNETGYDGKLTVNQAVTHPDVLRGVLQQFLIDHIPLVEAIERDPKAYALLKDAVMRFNIRTSSAETSAVRVAKSDSKIVGEFLNNNRALVDAVTAYPSTKSLLIEALARLQKGNSV